VQLDFFFRFALRKFLYVNRLIGFLFLATLGLSSCSNNQESKIIGVWERTEEDKLPEEYPKIYWEFTGDNDLIRYEITELEQILRFVGRWGLTKKNRLSVSKFDENFNGEWEIVYFKNDVLRMVLKKYNDQNQPQGQVLVEFVRVTDF
jgi:hypothetical protein